MNKEKWQLLKRCVEGDTLTEIPVALIVDSPWIPGYVGVSTIDYFQFPDVWLNANIKIEQDFPEVIFLPGFWTEFGMAAEPSGFGCRINFFENRTPEVHPVFNSVVEAENLPLPDPRQDGLMPFILNQYRKYEQKIKDAGYCVKVVAARGPLTTASYIVGITQLLMDLKLEPQKTHTLLRKTATLVQQWLYAQAESLSEVGAIMVLDDIVGFLSPKDYLEFAHPYLKMIFDKFPGCIKIFHNDNTNPASYKYLEELCIDIFNFTHLIELKKARELVGDKICLMGNIPPLDVLAQGTPEDVEESVKICLENYNSKKGLILSAGGGTSPGTPAENIRALVKSARNFRKI